MPKLTKSQAAWERRRREAQKLTNQLLKAGTKAEQIALVCSVTSAVVYRWKAGTSTLSVEHLKQLRRMAKWRR